MPSLDLDQRVQLIRPLDEHCPRCHARIVRQYCRSCDEFFRECWCPPIRAGHAGHRTYRWVDGSVVAEPDFDPLLR